VDLKILASIPAAGYASPDTCNFLVLLLLLLLLLLRQ
jgi:hypothetical protein